MLALSEALGLCEADGLKEILADKLADVEPLAEIDDDIDADSEALGL